MARTIGVCVIGAGRAGLIHAGNFRAGVDGTTLVAVSDPSEKARNAATSTMGECRGYADYQDALQDDRVDAVVVVAPTVFHREIVVAAAAAGKHVLCEKPMAMNATECHQMIEACEKAGVKLQVGFMRRFDDSFAAAKMRIQEGDLGAVNQVKSLTHGPSVPQEWMLDIEKSNGPLAEVCSHDIDTVRWLGGADIKHVYAIAGNYRCRDQAKTYPDFYDTVVLLCSLENGVQGVIDGAVSVGYAYDARAEILAENGVIQVGDLAANRVTTFKRGFSADFGAVRSWRNLFSEAYRREDEAFVEAIAGDTEPRVTGYDGLQAVMVVNAGNESIRTGKPVEVGG